MRSTKNMSAVHSIDLIWNGEPAAGLSEVVFRIEGPGIFDPSWYESEAEARQALETFREALKDAFACVGDGPPRVVFFDSGNNFVMFR